MRWLRRRFRAFCCGSGRSERRAARIARCPYLNCSQQSLCALAPGEFDAPHLFKAQPDASHRAGRRTHPPGARRDSDARRRPRPALDRAAGDHSGSPDVARPQARDGLCDAARRPGRRGDRRGVEPAQEGAARAGRASRSISSSRPICALRFDSSFDAQARIDALLKSPDVARDLGSQEGENKGET